MDLLLQGDEAMALCETMNVGSGISDNDEKLASMGINDTSSTSPDVVQTASLFPTSKNHITELQVQRRQNQNAFLSAIHDEEWENVEAMLEVNPHLAFSLVPLTLQGEDTMVHPLGAIAACSSRSLHGGVPLSLLEAFVTTNPTALLHGDSRGNRIPLMIALLTLTGGTSISTDDDSTSRKSVESMTKMRCIRYLFQSWSPRTLQHLDSQGNVALHYAARYCCSISCGCNYGNGNNRAHDNNGALPCQNPPNTLALEEMLQAYPEAAQVINQKQQLPLHLLVSAAVAADNGSMDDSLCCSKCTIRSLELMIQAHPEALQHKDRQGRLPLHVACASSSHPSWDVLQVLIQNYPAALACEDDSGKLPLELWIMMSPLRTTVVGSVSSLSLRQRGGGASSSLRQKAARKRALTTNTTTTTTTSGDNEVILACLQECTRREQDKKTSSRSSSSSGSQAPRFLGRVLSGLRGSNSGGGAAAATTTITAISERKKDAAILATFNNCYG